MRQRTSMKLCVGEVVEHPGSASVVRMPHIARRGRERGRLRRRNRSFHVAFSQPEARFAPTWDFTVFEMYTHSCPALGEILRATESRLYRKRS
jgi:hypothetical protein